MITYLRTDSTRVSETAEAQVKEFIEENYGMDYMTKDTDFHIKCIIYGISHTAGNKSLPY